MRQPINDIRAMCAEVNRKEAEDCLYLRWALNEHAMNIIQPWIKEKIKRQNFDEYKKSFKKTTRSSQKPDRAAFYAAYGAKIKTPEGGK